MRADATARLTGWLPVEPDQQQLRADYLAFLADHDDAMWRECRIGHLTASALVMDEVRSRVLLTLHPKVGRWLQLGGHCEPGDASLLEAARREAVEESGIAAVLISAQPLRLDRHPVPCAGAMSEHLDVQYLAIVSDDAQEVMSEESDDLRWFALDALPEGLDASVRALIEAANDGRVIGDFALQ
jgi:8-oxo-dGTP pyrophosphatase MutT (NUDIX family)